MNNQVIEELREAFAARMAADRKMSEAVIGMAQAVEQSLLAAERVNTPDVSRAAGKLWTVKETCERLGGICDSTLWRLRREGQIKFVRVGNRPMFPASEIEAYISRALRGGERVKQKTR